MSDVTTPVVISRPDSLAPMTQSEARRCCERIRHHLDDARSALLELHDRKGWVALGYDSWRACATAEFGQSQGHVYRLLNAAKIERELGESGIPERVLRPLADLPTPEERREVWQEVKTVTPQPTAEQVENATKHRREALPLWDKSGDSSYRKPTESEVKRIVEKAKQMMPPEALAELVRQEESQILKRREEIENEDREEDREQLHNRLITRIRQATSIARRLDLPQVAETLRSAMRFVLEKESTPSTPE